MIGLAWWFPWVPILMVPSGLSGVNLDARAPGVIWIGTGIAVVGLALTIWFHRWSRKPQRPGLARMMDAVVTGSSLRRAQAQLDELRRFEQD